VVKLKAHADYRHRGAQAGEKAEERHAAQAGIPGQANDPPQ
jgi:hypothetical protein